MFPTVAGAVDGLREAMASLEPGIFRGDDAASLLKLFAEAERLAAAGKALMARRVEETNAWRRDGHRSAAGWLAATTGSSVGSAVGTLETARRLEALPAIAEAQRAGSLSEAQAREISSAAAVDPAAEAELLAAAGREPVAALRQRCQRVRASAADDEAARHRAVHQRRRLRHWTDADGAFRMDLATTADAGATILGQLEAVLRPGLRRGPHGRGDAVLKVLVTNGVDVVAVAHAGRSVTAAQRSALEERDPACVVAGCAITKGLEIDHVDGWTLTHITKLERLARLCRWHHHLKTYCGYRLEGRASNWRLVAPDRPPTDDGGPGPPPAAESPGTLDLGLAVAVPT